MSIFNDDIIKRAQRRQKAQVGGAFIGGLVAIFFVGWLFFLTYNAFRPDAWPYIGLWTAFGISYLFRYAAATLRGE